MHSAQQPVAPSRPGLADDGGDQGLPVPPRIEIREICVVSQGSSRSKRSVLLVVLESKPSRPLTFGSWLVDRFGPAGCVAAMSPKEVNDGLGNVDGKGANHDPQGCTERSRTEGWRSRELGA